MVWLGWVRLDFSPQMGTFIEAVMAVGFRKGPQYLLKRVFWPLLQAVVEPAMMGACY